jgi:hypothetical protein
MTIIYPAECIRSMSPSASCVVSHLRRTAREDQSPMAAWVGNGSELLVRRGWPPRRRPSPRTDSAPQVRIGRASSPCEGLFLCFRCRERTGSLRPGCVTPDRQSAQDRAFGFAPIAAVQRSAAASRKRTSERRRHRVWISPLPDFRRKPPEGPLVSRELPLVGNIRAGGHTILGWTIKRERVPSGRCLALSARR